MNRRSDPHESRLRAIMYRREALAGLALLWERVWPAVWPAVGVLGVFSALALLDVFSALPGWLHIVLLVGFVVALGRALVHAVALVRMPTAEEARRRLETASGFDHRPLTLIDDSLFVGRGDAQSEALWNVHRKRMLTALRRLRIGVPSPLLSRRDPMAMRVAVALALVVGVAAAGGDWSTRIARAVTPSLGAGADALPPTLEVWVTPPDYTGAAPLYLDSAVAPGTEFDVPGGSVIMAQVYGGNGEPIVRLADEEFPLAAVDATTWQGEVPLEVERAGVRELSVTQGNEQLATWNLMIRPDRSPTIEFASDPLVTPRLAVQIEYSAEDDYGLDSVFARVLRPREVATERDTPIELALNLPGRGLAEAIATSYHDLTAHVWAGLPVEIELEARDGRGQSGFSDRFAMILPERDFAHPVARAIIEQRKRLAVEPENRVAIAGSIMMIAIEPEAYSEDLGVYLSLVMAQARLMHGRQDADIAAVQELLWDTALHVEEGSLSLAERDLRQLQRQLMEALSNDAPEEEIQQLMDELRSAMQRFMEALAENMQRQMEQGAEMQQADPNAMTMTEQDLQEMIDRMQEMAEMGARDAAREMLSQLQQMLENLRSDPSMAMRQQRNGEANQLMRGMQELIQRQQDLLDRTNRSAQQQQQQGREGGGEGGEMPSPAEQEGLRRMLGEMMRRMGDMAGDIPRPFGRAERSMRQSGQALEEGLAGDAIGPQAEALDQLQQGMESMMEQMMQPGGEMAFGGNQNQLEQMAPNRDPFGRTVEDGGTWDLGDIDIPGEVDLQRAREILNELRRRSGERGRPILELEYIERLLRRF